MWTAAARRRGAFRPNNYASAKLRGRDVIAIRREFAAGASRSELAAEFDVCECTIYLIVTRRTWRWLKERSYYQTPE